MYYHFKKMLDDYSFPIACLLIFVAVMIETAFVLVLLYLISVLT